MSISKCKAQLKGALESLAKKREIYLREKLINEIIKHLKKITIHALKIIHDQIFNMLNTNTYILQ